MIFLDYLFIYLLFIYKKKDIFLLDKWRSICERSLSSFQDSIYLNLYAAEVMNEKTQQKSQPNTVVLPESQSQPSQGIAPYPTALSSGFNMKTVSTQSTSNPELMRPQVAHSYTASRIWPAGQLDNRLNTMYSMPPHYLVSMQQGKIPPFSRNASGALQRVPFVDVGMKRKHEAYFSGVRKERRARSKTASLDPRKNQCTLCFTQETPKWRLSRENKKVLCNACGLQEMKRRKRDYQDMVDKYKRNGNLTLHSKASERSQAHLSTSMPSNSSQSSIYPSAYTPKLHGYSHTDNIPRMIVTLPKPVSSVNTMSYIPVSASVSASVSAPVSAPVSASLPVTTKTNATSTATSSNLLAPANLGEFPTTMSGIETLAAAASVATEIENSMCREPTASTAN